MQNINLYNSVLAALVLAFFAAFGWNTVAWEPYTGDLTRVGGYTERDFGWRGEQERFPERGYDVVRDAASYTGAYDVVVLGDSFSDGRERVTWLSYFAEQVGGRVLLLRYKEHELTLPDVLAAPGFLAHPPRLLIFETIERLAIPRLATLADWDDAAVPAADGAGARHDTIDPLAADRPPAVGPGPKRAARVLAERERDAPFALRVDQVAHRFRTKLGLASDRHGAERVAVLLPGGLLSSRRRDALLVYAGDYNKREVDDADIARAQAGWRRARRAAEATGNTAFLLMVFPDKSTVYGRFAVDPDRRTPNLVARLAEADPLLRLDEAFDAALDAGAPDLYLPNDSHAGHRGSQLAADAVADELIRRRVSLGR